MRAKPDDYMQSPCASQRLDRGILDSRDHIIAHRGRMQFVVNLWILWKTQVSRLWNLWTTRFALLWRLWRWSYHAQSLDEADLRDLYLEIYRLSAEYDRSSTPL